MSTSRYALTRRSALMVGAGALLGPRKVFSQTYPSRIITLVCAFPPGSGADTLVRYFANKLSLLSGQTVIVENKPGALANIAAEYTARAKPDGYTMFLHAASTIAANMSILRKPPLNVATDLQTIATCVKLTMAIVVRTESPYKNLADLVADQKEKGDAGSYALGNTPGKLLGEELKQVTGLKTVAIQYKTVSDSINDVMSGNVDWAVFDTVVALSQLRQGKVRILAVGSSERMAGALDIPTIKEQGIDITQEAWWGLMVPRGVAPDIINKINEWFRAIVQTEDTKKFLQDQAMVSFVSSPQEAQTLMERSVQEMKRLVQIAGIPQE